MNCTLVRAAVILGGLAWALTLGACATPSVHPIYTAADTPLIEPGLVGTWKQSGDKETYTITRAGDGYHMLVKNNEASGAKQWEFSVRLVQLGDSSFADIAAVEEERQAHEEHWGPLFVPTHMFAAWALDKDTLTVRMLKREWLERTLADKKIALGCTRLDGHTLLITADTEDLQAFLKEHAKDDAAFADVVKLERAKNQR